MIHIENLKSTSPIIKVSFLKDQITTSPVLWIRIRSIRIFLVGPRRLEPDPDAGPNKWHNINIFGVCKSHKC
jgi:hypothetical protein